MFESAMVTLSLRNMSQPSVFFASLDEVDTAEMVIFLKTTFFPSLTYTYHALGSVGTTGGTYEGDRKRHV